MNDSLRPHSSQRHLMDDTLHKAPTAVESTAQLKSETVRWSNSTRLGKGSPGSAHRTLRLVRPLSLPLEDGSRLGWRNSSTNERFSGLCCEVDSVDTGHVIFQLDSMSKLNCINLNLINWSIALCTKWIWQYPPSPHFLENGRGTATNKIPLIRLTTFGFIHWPFPYLGKVKLVKPPGSQVSRSPFSGKFHEIRCCQSHVMRYTEPLT